MAKKWIFWFDELTKDSYELVGKKCANLGEMTRAGLPVPPGFALSIDAYNLFMLETGASEEIRDYVSTMSLENLSTDETASRHIRDLVEGHPLPEWMKEDVRRQYEELCRATVPNVAVAVRSSGVVSMPGQMESYLNIRGAEEVARKIVEVWGSSFSFQAIAYRAHKNLPLESFPIGVAVMKVVNAKCSGVAFSVHPNTGDRNKMLIEANWGLGEGVVGGGVSPDQFVIDRRTGTVSSFTVNCKHQHVVPIGDGTGWMPVPDELQSCSCLEDAELAELVKLAERLEREYGEPQDIEWVFDRDFELPDSLRVVQTRPAKIAQGQDPAAQSEYLIELMLNTVFRRT